MEVPVASAEVLLKRFLYISETECAYVPGNVFAHQFKKNQETVYDLILQLENGEKHILIEKIFKDVRTFSKIFLQNMCYNTYLFNKHA